MTDNKPVLFLQIDQGQRSAMDDVPLFPDRPAIIVERTLAIVKPDAMECADEIVEEIKRKGFTILKVCLRMVHTLRRICVTCFCQCCLRDTITFVDCD